MAALLLLGLFGSPGAAHSAPREPQGEVEQIEAEGMIAFGVSELESVLELEAGERYDPALAARSAENLKELYRYRGFPEASVTAEWTEQRVLKVIVREGRPVRIAEVKIIPEGDRSRDNQLAWRKNLPKLKSLLNLRAGDIFDQERATATARLLQSALQEEEYVGSSVNEVKVDRVDRGSDTSTSGWVALQIRVDLGDLVSFGFRGNQYFSRNELIEQLQEQRALGLGRNYLETLQARLLETYSAAGFGRASIRAFPRESQQGSGRHVTWVIDEGPRWRVGAIEFDGNEAFSDRELLRIFGQGLPRMLENRIYVQSEVDKAAEFLVQKLKSRGYLSARLLSLQTLWNRAHTEATLQLYLFEGGQTRVGEVEVFERGKTAEVDRATALRLLGTEPGEAFNIYAFNDGIQQLKRWYRNRGHLEAAVLNEGKAGNGISNPDAIVQYSDENRIANIRVEVIAGRKFRASKIRVRGLSKTRESVLLREISLRPGDVLTEQAVFDSESSLRKLGLFSGAQIRLEPDESDPDLRVVQVEVDEGTPGLLAGGVGFRNDLGVRVFGTTSYGNLFGKNHTVVFSTTLNRRVEDRRVPVEYQAQLGYIWPWFGWNDLSFRPNVTFQRIQYVNFDASTLALAATWEKKLLKDSNLIAALNYSLERIEQNAEDANSIDNQTLTIGALTPSVRLDLRDNPLAPTRGFYGSLSFEWSDPALLSQVDPFPVGYTRMLFRSDYTWNFWRDLTWYFSFRSGLERNTQDITDPRVAIPLIKQFALGGAASLRGFREQELNIQDIAVRGTASYVNYRTQLDLPISGPMRFGPFIDAANLLVDRYSFSEGVRFGTGFGLHYLTPVGPINFDLGFKVAPREGEEAYRFYFSIGMI